MFWPESDDMVADLGASSPFSSGRSKLFVPNHVSPRIRSQSGLFSVQKPSKDHGYIPFEKNKHTREKLEKIEIEPGYFQHLRYELGCMRHQLLFDVP